MAGREGGSRENKVFNQQILSRPYIETLVNPVYKISIYVYFLSRLSRLYCPEFTYFAFRLANVIEKQILLLDKISLFSNACILIRINQSWSTSLVIIIIIFPSIFSFVIKFFGSACNKDMSGSATLGHSGSAWRSRERRWTRSSRRSSTSTWKRGGKIDTRQKPI